MLTIDDQGIVLFLKNFLQKQREILVETRIITSVAEYSVQ
jgi:hypothetical protein